MRDNKIKVIRKKYDKYPDIQEVIKLSMTDVCPEEGVSPEQVFVYFAISLLFSLAQLLF